MSKPIYDQVDDFYINFVDRGLSDSSTLFSQTVEYLLTMTGNVSGQRVLDLCCGEGHVARALANRGALVTGVDLSEHNIATANERNVGPDNPNYIVGDAQALTQLDDRSFDLVVCKMALMDIPDVAATFRAVARVLKGNGQFIAGLLHPCFETPFTVPFERFEVDETGRFVSLRVQRYLEEGHWQSGGTGVRGHVGAYHRTVSNYINMLISAGFQLARLEEPLFAVGEPNSAEAQMSQHIPRLLFWEARLASCP